MDEARDFEELFALITHDDDHIPRTNHLVEMLNPPLFDFDDIPDVENEFSLIRLPESSQERDDILRRRFPNILLPVDDGNEFLQDIHLEPMPMDEIERIFEDLNVRQTDEEQNDQGFQESNETENEENEEMYDAQLSPLPYDIIDDMIYEAEQNQFLDDFPLTPMTHSQIEQMAGEVGNEQSEQTGSGNKRLHNSVDPEEEEGIVSYSQEAGPSHADEESTNATGSSSPRDYYEIKNVKEVKSKKFQTTGTDYYVAFRDIDVRGLENVIPTLYRVIEDLLNRVLHGVAAHDMVRLVLDSDSLDSPISFPFRRRSDITPEYVMSRIEKVLQSNEDFVLNNGVRFNIIHVALPYGGSGHHLKRKKYFLLEKYLKNKRCVITIKNDDEMCMARALVTAKARLDNHPQLENIRKSRAIQETLAIELHARSGVPIGEQCGIEEAKRFQEVMPGYQINILSKDFMGAIIYSGPEAENKLYIYHHNNHYDVITSMAAFLSKNHFCTHCNTGYDHITSHRCVATCNNCFRGFCKIDNDEDWIYCSDCNRYFKGEQCFQNHKYETAEAKNSTCRNYVKCKSCSVIVNAKLQDPKEHQCGQVQCKVCKKMVDPNSHLCYMRKVTPNTRKQFPNRNEDDDELITDMSDDNGTVNENDDDEKPRQYIFFDLETLRRLQSNSGTVYELDPNLAVVQKCCDLCKDDFELDSESYCENCGYKEKVFGGRDTMNDFCDYLFQECHENAICIAHNLKGFDSYPVLRYIYDQSIVPKVILSGAKVMSIEVPKLSIKFIDSLNFLPMALSKLPSTFGFTELEKGYFPHLFNTEENQNYVGPLPDRTFYGYDDMRSVKDQEKFDEWYQRLLNNNYVFDFQEEIKKYCKSDVTVLRCCSMQFRSDFMKICNIDPFESCITIASACNLVFRTNFLKNESIGVIPPLGYQPERQYSYKATKWLMWIQHQSGHHVKHAKNGGEFHIGNYHVDGYVQLTNTALEFHGCLFHGCRKCYNPDTINPVNGKTMQELYENTLKKKRFILSQGVNYEEIWECQYEKELCENAEMNAFVSSIKMSTPIKPRDAFFGGRTNATCLYYEAKEGEQIHYVDFTSLYPFTNKYKRYGIGHPRIIVQNFGNIEDYFGLIKCKILPPRGLFHPVLPVRCSGKLTFPLCSKCAEIKQQTPCHHTSEERAITGTWVTLEVQKAVEMGYIIQEIEEVWHFEETSDTLFAEYVNTFLKLKQEASGWPTWCNSEEDREHYIREYFVKEGVELVYDNIQKNPGLRALAKLMLNSFWGKFGQKTRMGQVETVTTAERYFELLTSDEYEVSEIIPMNDEMMEVHFKCVDEFEEIQARTNVIIAAFTTCHARLTLYDLMTKLGERVLYHDTDSVVYIQREGEWKPPLGDYLGDLTDELDGHCITTFVSGGPKNYAYQTENGKTVCKVRGITLNCRSEQVVNFNTLKNMVRNFVPGEEVESVPVYEPHKITRDSRKKILLSKPMYKDYRVVYDKRVVCDNFFTLPYGY